MIHQAQKPMPSPQSAFTKKGMKRDSLFIDDQTDDISDQDADNTMSIFNMVEKQAQKSFDLSTRNGLDAYIEETKRALEDELLEADAMKQDKEIVGVGKKDEEDEDRGVEYSMKEIKFLFAKLVEKRYEQKNEVKKPKVEMMEIDEKTKTKLLNFAREIENIKKKSYDKE